ncbi:MAG: proline racemase family protein, partial [Longimicrobiales bacterium]|nr:proline racemase family protein [Longimicrobiales bacterium]
GEAQATFDTPAGFVEARVVGEGPQRYAEFVNVASAPLEIGTRLRLRDGQTITADVVYAGNAYLIVDAGQFGLPIAAETLPRLKRLWAEVREAANGQMRIRHPLDPERLIEFDLVQFYGPPTHREAHARNVVICTGQISRSPCGTGTCARAAALWGRGELRVGGEFVNEGLAGDIFRVRPIAEVELAGQQAIVPRVRGQAYVTGMHQFVIDPADPFRHGFVSPAA